MPSTASVNSESLEAGQLAGRCLLVSPPRTGKTTLLATHYANFIAKAASAAKVPRVLWLAPHRIAAERVTATLLERGMRSSLSPGVKTLARFCESLVSLDSQSPQLIPRTASRLLLQHVANTAIDTGELKSLTEVLQRPGTLDTLENMIGELKTRAVSHQRFERWASSPSNTRRDRELATVYSRYQTQLEALRSADRFDFAPLAVKSLARKFPPDAPPAPLWDLVVVDGFTSFSLYERALLLKVFQSSQNVLASIDVGGAISAPTQSPPLEDGATLHHAAGRTLQWLRSLEPAFRELPFEKTQRAESGSSHQTFDYMRQHLFASSDEVAPPADAQQNPFPVCVLPAAHTQDEVVRVARKVKHLIAVEGVNPTDIVVATPSLRGYRRRVEEVFTSFGVPVSIASPRVLGESPEVSTLASLLSLAAENWPYRDTVGAFSNGLLTALSTAADSAASNVGGSKWRTPRGAAEWLVRDLQIASGRTPLLETVARLAEAGAADPTTVRPREQAAVMARPAIELLAQASDELPNQATPLEWIAACGRLANRLGLQLLPTPNAAWNEVPQAAAWAERLQQQLTPHDNESNDSNDSAAKAPKWTLAEWLAQLDDWANWLPVANPLQEGAVAVLQAESARHASPKHLFLIGLDEQSFNSSSGGGAGAGSIYSEQQFDALATLASSDPADNSLAVTPPYQRAMQLFYDLVCLPHESLTLSFPALDSGGQTTPPSPLLVELCRLFGGVLEKPLAAIPEITALPPVGEAPLSTRDWRLRAIADGSDKKIQTLGSLLQSPLTRPASDSLVSALVMLHHRVRGDSFGTFEGMVSSPAARKWLAQQFGPDHLWSTSQLETYAYCPYQFLLKNVLRLTSPGDLALETDYSRRGDLMHKALAELHTRLDLALSSTPQDTATDEQTLNAQFHETFDGALDSVLAEFASFGIEGVMNELLAGQVRRWGTKYRKQVATYNAESQDWEQPLTPTHFELRFGKASRHSVDEQEAPASTDQPLEIDLGDEKLLVCGRIDRVDVGRVGNSLVFQVIDYKSARDFTMKDQEVEDGRKLQPTLYAMAAAEIIATPDSPAYPLKAGYWVVQQKGFTDKTYRALHTVEAGQVQATPEWQDIEQKTHTRLREIVAGIRAGNFPMYSADDKCTERCDFSHVCRIGQVRSLGKTWPPPEEETDAATDSANPYEPKATPDK